jgi:preprotein translocase subunit SecA
VTIATNMAGRGTDIKLAPIGRDTLVHHWQQRNFLPKQAAPDMDDQTMLDLALRHIATWTLGMKSKEVDAISGDEVKMMLLRKWACEYAWLEEDKADKLSEQQLLSSMDKHAAGFMLHRLTIFTHIEQMGGLHIVGTERHEARRIDNQLRGRAGRQGDNGSSRFFISLEDDLMKMFAGKTTLTALSKLGMKEGDAIEHKWITKSVERAQRKVEERNYEIRKNLLEYDEVMEHQRNDFYATRQAVIEGHDVSKIVFDYISDAVDDAVGQYLDKGYVSEQVAEWCRQTLDVSVDPGKLVTRSMSELEETIRKEAQAEARQVIELTLGEYMPGEMSPDDWDLRGLSSWAMSRFSVDLKQNQLRKMTPPQVQDDLSQAAAEQIDHKDLSGLQKFSDPLYAQNDLVAWCQQQFGVELPPEDFADVEAVAAADQIIKSARDAYAKRECQYPIEFALDMAHSIAQTDPDQAIQQLLAWAQQRYEVDWTFEQMKDKTVGQLEEDLRLAAKPWVENGKMQAVVDKALAENSSVEQLVQWAEDRFGEVVKADDLADPEQRSEVLLASGRAMLRRELMHLECFVMLQILDSTWKEHLYTMDQLKDAVSLHAYAEKDPRIEYKREGSNEYLQMQKTVRDRVTELIFRARLTADVEQRDVYGRQEASHDEARGALAGQGTAEQQADQQAANQAGGQGDDDSHLSRHERRARRAKGADPASEGKRKRSPKQRKKRK